MKVKRDDTEEARRYWKFLDENSKIVKSWPKWKQNSIQIETPVSPNDTPSLNSEKNKVE